MIPYIILFITGTSGSGKTTLIQYLQKQLSKNLFEIYDFDENGVPADADQEWRQKTTGYWLTKAQENSTHKKSTIICGVTVPTEILNSSKKTDQPIYFGFIKVADEEVRQRLKQRGWNDQLIHDNINWAHYLEAEVKKQKNHIIVDNSVRRTPEEIAYELVQWINSIMR